MGNRFVEDADSFHVEEIKGKFVFRFSWTESIQVRQENVPISEIPES